MISCRTGEFCVFKTVQHVLTCSVPFKAIHVSFQTVCQSMHTFDPSMCSLHPFGLSWGRFVLPIGMSGDFCLFCGILTMSGVFAGLFASV